MKTLLFIFGTRPEAIKVAPLILKLKQSLEYEILVCSTGQHREMLKPLLSFFKITPDYEGEKSIRRWSRLRTNPRLVV